MPRYGWHKLTTEVLMFQIYSVSGCVRNIKSGHKPDIVFFLALVSSQCKETLNQTRLQCFCMQVCRGRAPIGWTEDESEGRVKIPAFKFLLYVLVISSVKKTECKKWQKDSSICSLFHVLSPKFSSLNNCFFLGFRYSFWHCDVQDPITLWKCCQLKSSFINGQTFSVLATCCHAVGCAWYW